MPIGTVKWYDIQKGQGAIEPEEDGEEVLVDLAAIRDAPDIVTVFKGLKLKFDITENYQGKKIAINLARVK